MKDPRAFRRLTFAFVLAVVGFVAYNAGDGAHSAVMDVYSAQFHTYGDRVVSGGAFGAIVAVSFLIPLLEGSYALQSGVVASSLRSYGIVIVATLGIFFILSVVSRRSPHRARFALWIGPIVIPIACACAGWFLSSGSEKLNFTF